jgi:hypothetical protein
MVDFEKNERRKWIIGITIGIFVILALRIAFVFLIRRWRKNSNDKSTASTDGEISVSGLSAWSRVIGTCSTKCGTGNRAITYECNVANKEACGEKPPETVESCSLSNDCGKALSEDRWVWTKTGDSVNTESASDPRCTALDGYQCQPGVVYNGVTELGSLEDVKSVEECSKKCHEKGCEYFSHSKDRNTCYLKLGKVSIARTGGNEATYTKVAS